MPRINICMPRINMPKTRKARRDTSKVVYLSGKARKPHINKPEVRRSLEESISLPGPSTSSSV